MTASKPAVEDEDDDFPPLDIKCTDTDCENGLHCFLRDNKAADPHPDGSCRECGAELVDWPRVHDRDAHDAAHTFKMLQYELIRHRYWHHPISLKERNYTRRKGRVGILVAAEKRIRRSVAAKEPFKDGAQTPWTGHILYSAQHATASCCRTCIEEWHAIPKGRELAEDEINYLTELVCLYVCQRVPELTEKGEKVPRIRKPVQPKG